jgi:hypothetical protein
MNDMKCLSKLPKLLALCLGLLSLVAGTQAQAQARVSSCGVTGSAPDIICGETITPASTLKCQITVVGYAPASAVYGTLQVGIVRYVNGISTVLSYAGSNPYAFFPAAQGSTSTSSITQWDTVTAGTTVRYGCRYLNLSGQASCNVNWVCI